MHSLVREQDFYCLLRVSGSYAFSVTFKYLEADEHTGDYVVLAFAGLGPTEILLIVLFVVIIVMGPKKIPELFRALGQSVGELKKGMKEGDVEPKEGEEKEGDAESEEEEAPKKAPPKKKKTAS
jgi:sec-independent protein translocase protein TatA